MNLPLVNACLNASATIVLLGGLWAIKSGRRELHGRLMVTATVISALFLASYLYYHFAIKLMTPYNGRGIARTLYLALLASHVVLAMVNAPMVVRTLYLAWREDWPRHRAWARWTFPIWLYVSVTGVLVYLVLYVWNPPAQLG
jgi:uncharacterized membrane protein YozB (DUF420 family)